MKNVRPTAQFPKLLLMNFFSKIPNREQGSNENILK